VHHPSLQGRRLVLLGSYNEASAWAERTDIDVAGVMIATTARQIVNLPAREIHIVVLPSVRNWRNPYYFMLRTELNFMHAKGATVEWA
jgi:hypothetical protein